MRYFIFWAVALALSGCFGNEQLKYTQLFAGFNGPNSTGTTQFTDRASIEKSWLASALTKKELDNVLSKVNFKKQILLAVAIGKRETSTGSVAITDIDKLDSSVIPYVRIGVNDEGCNQSPSFSYPFVLAVVERPNNDVAIGYDLQNFPDGCKKTKSGNANDVGPVYDEPK